MGEASRPPGALCRVMDQIVHQGQWEVWRKVWDPSYVEKSSGQVHDLFHFPAGTTHTGMGRRRDHVFLLRCGSLNCVSVTAYIVSAPRGPWILNSGSDSFALLLIMQVANESTQSEED